MSFIVGGCATLPTSGPTLSEIESSANSSDSTISYRLVPIDKKIVNKELAASTASSELSAFRTLAAHTVPDRVDEIRAGDSLEISIFEVGFALFSPQQTISVGADTPPTADSQVLRVNVRDDGSIDLPYIGKLRAAGTFPEQLAATIRSRLRGLSQSPEVMISIPGTVRNVAYVNGYVRNPGRFRLTSARERLLDILTVAGGLSINTSDAIVRFVRRDQAETVRLNEIKTEDIANLVVLPGDRIEVIKAAKTYTVFGAANSVRQIDFEADSVTLAEAIARAAGPSDARANPRGVFLFRLIEPNERGQPLATVYQLNMKRPEAYFLAQMVNVKDKDVLLFANASSNLTSKFISMLNQLVSPAITAATIQNATKN